MKKIMKLTGSTLICMFIFLLLIISSCKKDNPDDPIQVDPTDYLVGTWKANLSGAGMVVVAVTVGRRVLSIEFTKNSDGTLKGKASVKHYYKLPIFGEKSFTMKGTLEDIQINKDMECPWSISFKFPLVTVPLLGSYSMRISNGQLDCNGNYISGDCLTQTLGITKNEGINLEKQ